MAWLQSSFSDSYDVAVIGLQELVEIKVGSVLSHMTKITDKTM